MEEILRLIVQKAQESYKPWLSVIEEEIKKIKANA